MKYLALPALLLLPALAGCGGRPPPPPPQAARNGCMLPSQQPAQIVDLYFGRDVPGRAPVRDAEWAEFVVHQIAPRFPDGFTVFDGTGQWLNPKTQRVVREASKMLRIVAQPTADLPARVQEVADAYKSRFRQQEVGIVSTLSCAGF